MTQNSTNHTAPNGTFAEHFPLDFRQERKQKRGGLEPGVGDGLVEGGGGVDAVGGPMLPRRAGAEAVEDRLQRDEDRAVRPEAFGGGLHDGAALAHFGAEELAVVGLARGEGLEENELHVREFFDGPVEQFVVDARGAGDLDAVVVLLVPRVVDADEDRDEVGRVVEAVRAPARVEVDDAVAADAEVEELESGVGAVAGESRLDQAGIARAHQALFVAAATAARAAAVGDGIALEEDLHFLLSFACRSWTSCLGVIV